MPPTIFYYYFFYINLNIIDNDKLEEIVEDTTATTEFVENLVLITKYYIKKKYTKRALSIIRKKIIKFRKLENYIIIWIFKFLANLDDNRNVDDIITQCSTLISNPQCLLESAQYDIYIFYIIFIIYYFRILECKGKYDKAYNVIKTAFSPKKEFNFICYFIHGSLIDKTIIELMYTLVKIFIIFHKYKNLYAISVGK